MKYNGAAHRSRIAAFLLTVMMLMTTCMTPAYAANIWDELILSVLWTDGSGEMQKVPALPVQSSADRAYWVNIDPAAMNQTLTVEAITSNPAYSFYFEDGMGGHTSSFTWTDEMDAQDLNPASAYTLFFAVDGQQADMPILLYVSSSAMPETDAFEPFPVQVKVDYCTEDNTLLDSQFVECWAGETTPVWAASANTEGYMLLGSDMVNVTVDQTGNANPPEVIFLYRQTAAPDPTAEPTAEPIKEATVPVAYYHLNGETLDFQEVYLTPGTHTIQANSNKVSGYVLTSDAEVTINVYPDGTTDLASVVFYYDDPAPAEAVIPVYYMHEDGRTLDMKEVTLPEGLYTITPDSDRVGDFELTGADSAEVTVYSDGSSSVANVKFLYKDKYIAPAEAVIPVYYMHEDCRTLDMKEVTLPEGLYTITPDSDRVGDFELTGADSAEVTVYSDGSSSVANVKFLYKDKAAAPVQVTIPVNYLHVDRGLLVSSSVTLPEGTYIVTADESLVSGVTPVGSTSVEVTVFADGSTHPGTIDFYYEDAQTEPVFAALTIVYQLADGTVIASDTVTLAPGTYTIQPDSSKMAGYQPEENQSHLVQVGEDGSISEEVVSFYCRPAPVTITVHYLDDRGRDVAPNQYRSFDADGEYVIQAAPEGLSADYELAPGMQTEDTVTISGGAASKTDVYFYYRLKQTAPVSAVVTVGYFDTEGNKIADPQSRTLELGTHQVMPDAGHVPAGYELVSEASIPVEVFENGTFSPQEVAFYYRKQQASITVFYRDDRGNNVADSQTLLLDNGTHIIEAKPENLKAGYEIIDGTDTQVSVTVRNGVPNKNQVVFYYKKVEATPTEFDLPVSYYDTEGKQIATTQYVKIAPGSYTIKANPADLPSGYELMMEDTLLVKVFEDGTTDPEEIAFYYKAPVKKAAITVSYVDQQNRSIAEPFTMKLDPGYHTVNADPTRVPSGYDPSSAEPVKVYVSREGEANPTQVVLVFDKLVFETPIPVGQHVYRYATVTGKDVALRSEPSTARQGNTVLKRVKINSKVYVMQEIYNDEHEVWAQVIVNGKQGYMKSEFLEIMTQAQSDAYAAGSTPAPTFTPMPVPTATPTMVPTEAPTATPTYEPTQAPIELITPAPAETSTLEPLPTESAIPTVSPNPTPYEGYALTTRATELRTGISSSDMTVIQSLAANELVNVVDQLPDPATGEMWAIVSTLNNQAGFVPASALRKITDEEAEPYLLFWEAQNKLPKPTELATATPEPIQLEGYGMVLGAEVPFRQMASEYSRIIDNLEAGTIVYITGQTLTDGQYWHSVNYEGYWGYIRADLVRMLTIAEEEEYLDRLHATPEPVTTNLPFDVNGLSSYGYVDGSSVNWREGPSTNAKRIGELKRYALCLVLGTERVNNVTWYKVNYDGKTGYLHGDFFKQLTISEWEQFMRSDEYLQGIANNAESDDAPMDDVGFTGTGGIVSAEDQWVNKNPDVYASFAPFNPIGTVQPIQTTPTLEPLPSWMTTAPTSTPTASPTFNPLPEVTYPTSGNGEGGSALIWVVVTCLLVLAVGGVFGLVRYQQNRRRIAMRAAQRRAQAARAQQRPYARNAAQGQPRMGMYPDQQSAVYRPASDGTPTQTTSQYTRFSSEKDYSGGSYYHPAQPEQTAPEGGDTQRVPRVGRRTTHRQAQQNAEQNDENSFDA